MATKEREQRRVPVPPVTKRQEEEFAEAVEEHKEDPARQIRSAIRQAQAALRAAEDALDDL